MNAITNARGHPAGILSSLSWTWTGEEIDPISVSLLFHGPPFSPVTFLFSVFLILFGAILLVANISRKARSRSGAEIVVGAVLIGGGWWFLLSLFYLPSSPALDLLALVVMGILTAVALAIIIFERGFRKP